MLDETTPARNIPGKLNRVEDLVGFATDPLKERHKKVLAADGRFLEDYIGVRDQYLGSRQDALPTLARTPRSLCCQNAADIHTLGGKQRTYFKSLDSGKASTAATESIFADPQQSVATKEWDLHFQHVKARLKSTQKMHEPSHTVVMEAAFFLLRHGVLIVPETGRPSEVLARMRLFSP